MELGELVSGRVCIGARRSRRIFVRRLLSTRGTPVINANVNADLILDQSKAQSLRCARAIPGPPDLSLGISGQRESSSTTCFEAVPVVQDLQSRKLGRPSQGQLMDDVLPIGAHVALPLLIQCEVTGRGRIMNPAWASICFSEGPRKAAEW